MTKNEFIKIYLDDSKKMELIDRFGWAPESVDLENIINESFSDVLENFIGVDGLIDEDNFSFREFNNDLELLIEEKIGG